MASIEMIHKDGANFFIGIVEFDDCSEVMENFDGEVQMQLNNNTINCIFYLLRAMLSGKQCDSICKNVHINTNFQNTYVSLGINYFAVFF